MAKPPLDQEQLARLRSEAIAPGRGFRRFFYVAFSGSAFLGAFVFLMKAIAGEDLAQTLPNLLLQIGIGAALVWFWRREQPPKA
jgi:Low psii accumulation1 / Rep27